MAARFDVLFAGQLLEGRDAATVRANLGRLFNADEATLDKLFSGKPQILKRDADAATAHKYQQALEKAGALAELRPCNATETVPAAAATAAPQSGLALAPAGTEVLAPGERAATAAPTVRARHQPSDPGRGRRGHPRPGRTGTGRGKHQRQPCAGARGGRLQRLRPTASADARNRPLAPGTCSSGC